MSVNGLLPAATNGAGTGWASVSVPAASVCSARLPAIGAPSIVRSTFEFGVKPVADDLDALALRAVLRLRGHVARLERFDRRRRVRRGRQREREQQRAGAGR